MDPDPQHHTGTESFPLVHSTQHVSPFGAFFLHATPTPNDRACLQHKPSQSGGKMLLSVQFLPQATGWEQNKMISP